MLMHLATNETTVSVKKKTGYLYCVKFPTKWFVNLTLKRLFKFKIILNKIQTMRCDGNGTVVYIFDILE